MTTLMVRGQIVTSRGANTPLEVRALRLRGLPPLPLGSRFPEVNVRTYATIDGRAGIYFFSLDAGSRLAVAAARAAYDNRASVAWSSVG
jgi:uncharacterized protein YqjF (DUF2071 family)